MNKVSSLLSRYGNYNSLRRLVLEPKAVLTRLFRDFGRKDEKLLGKFLGIDVREFISYYDQLYRERLFFRSIAENQSLLESSKLRAGLMDKREAAMIYALVRYLKAEYVLETGVASGLSSSHILLALHHNNRGHLVSIDLPNTNGWTGRPCQILPENKKPGWLVPDYLKSRWTLLIGDARNMLPTLLERQTSQIDLFLHDSLHTYEHMLWEFETIWPHLQSGGILVADDADANSAINDFSSQVELKFINIYGLGIMRKKRDNLICKSVLIRYC